MQVPKGIDKFLKRDISLISNEFYTPEYAVLPLIKYLKEYENKLGKKLTIWCPMSLSYDFEFEDGIIPKSNYIKVFERYFNVISSHIFEGKDFFEYEPKENYDIIIDNPPFKGKSKFFKRALELDKPFLFLMTLTCLNDKNPMNLFKQFNKQPQIMFFNKRIRFIKPNGDVGKHPPFACGYIGQGILPKDIILEELNC